MTAQVLYSINPANGEPIESYQFHTRREVDDALELSGRAFKTWRGLSFDERGRHLESAADQLRRQKARFAELMTAEMGKPIVEAEAEIEKCAWACEYFAAAGEGMLSDQPVASSASESSVVFDPLGTLLGIMPWNYPFWQVFRYAAPALMAGNVTILKHAPNVPGSAEAVEGVFREAGFPDGVFQSLRVDLDCTTELIDDERVRCVTLTGSERAGVLVAERCGRNIKKVVLELGGSDPFIVLADADLGGAVATAVNARYQNTGQSCIAAKRLIVAEELADEFVGRFVETTEQLKTGDPMDRDTKVGPMAREDLLVGIAEQIGHSVEKGARVLLGGRRVEGPGSYLLPTVLDQVVPGMPAFDDELFGPVANVVRAESTEHAIALANESRFGLGAAIWTADVSKGRDLARRIEAGSVFINGMVASDPRLPMGGVKNSGLGRELGEFGIREFTNIKALWIGPRQD